MLLSVPGGCLHYDLLGMEGAPVVCMTHSLTSDAGMWAEQVPELLKAGFQVLRLDMRGHGGSSPIPGPCSMLTLANDVLTVLDAVGIDRFHFVGLSIGGMIAQQFAVWHPGRVLSLTLSSTAARTMGDPSFLRQRMQAILEAGSLDSIVDENMERRYSNVFKAAHPARWQALRETFLRTSVEGYVSCMEAILSYDVSEQLSSLTVPTLVICGSDDVGTPPALSREIAGLIPGARYEEIAGGRHFPNVEFQDQFNAVLLNWLQPRREG